MLSVNFLVSVTDSKPLQLLTYTTFVTKLEFNTYNMMKF